MDGDADPGEVVWTWVPYQEDASVGKDRPAVVIGAQGEGVYLLQLTSKDHTREAAQEAAAGRYWFDIGTGAWDSKGRPSEVRLDRALWVKATDVRREGSILPEVTWRRIVDALEEHTARTASDTPPGQQADPAEECATTRRNTHDLDVTDLTRPWPVSGRDGKQHCWYAWSLDSRPGRAGGLVRTVCGCPHA